MRRMGTKRIKGKDGDEEKKKGRKATSEKDLRLGRVGM